jgi:hypothetical protein
MTDQPLALLLADELENPSYGWIITPKQCAAELRRLHAENEALKAAQYECGFGAGCCYQAAKSEADEALLRQALDAITNVLVGGDFDNPYADLKQAAAALKERLR